MKREAQQIESSLPSIAGVKVEDVIEKLIQTSPIEHKTSNLTVYEWCLDWAGSQSMERLYDAPKGHWKALFRSKEEKNFSVCAHQCLTIPYQEVQNWQKPAHARMRIYGAIPFDSKWRTPYTWAGLNHANFFLPSLEWVIDRACPRLYVRVTKKGSKEQPLQKAIKLLEKLAVKAHPPPPPRYPIIAEDSLDEPDAKKWAEIINEAKDSFLAGQLDKVVLSRVKHIKLAKPISSGQIIKGLDTQEESAYLFAMESPDGAAFVGRSPERLLSWKGKNISVDAIAGTRERSSEATEDTKLIEELETSSKDTSEHRCVTRFVEKVLSSDCETFKKECDLSPLKLTYVHHMISRYKGKLRKSVHPFKTLQALHPTPAVSGLPQEDSIKFIASKESFDRGLFAGTIGWTDGNSGDFAISIRSAFLSKDHLRIYAGAGIVKDSIPEREWDEISAKMKPFTQLLHKTF